MINSLVKSHVNSSSIKWMSSVCYLTKNVNSLTFLCKYFLLICLRNAWSSIFASNFYLLMGCNFVLRNFKWTCKYSLLFIYQCCLGTWQMHAEGFQLGFCLAKKLIKNEPFRFLWSLGLGNIFFRFFFSHTRISNIPLGAVATKHSGHYILLVSKHLRNLLNCCGNRIIFD